MAVLELPSVRMFSHICASHIALALRIPLDARKAALERAGRGRWSVRELQQRVVALRRVEGERRGRPALESEQRLVSTLRATLHVARQLRWAQLRVADVDRLQAKVLLLELHGQRGLSALEEAWLVRSLYCTAPTR